MLLKNDTHGMDDASHEVVIVDRFENDLHVAVQQSRLGEEFRFFSQRFGCRSIGFAFSVQFKAGALSVTKFISNHSINQSINEI